MVSFRTFLLVATWSISAASLGCGAPGIGGAAVVDAAVDAGGGRNDAGVGGGGDDASEAGFVEEAGFDTGTESCNPVSLSSFSPVYNLPVGPYAGLCTDQQIQTAVTACFGSGSSPSGDAGACKTWLNDPANAACRSCWAGPVTGTRLEAGGPPRWSPILLSTTGNEVLLNLAGCIALADPSQYECAQAIEYATECEIAACLEACPIPASGDAAALYGCTHQADLGGCTGYSAMASACNTTLTTSPADFCLHIDSGPHFNAEDLVRYFTLACGSAPAPMDAGYPGDGGASGDN